MKIAIAVQKGLTTPNLSTDDWLIKSALEKQGIHVDVIDWREKETNLSQYDSIFVSSTWNVPRYSAEFIKWMEQCESGKKRLINDAEVLRVSMNRDEYLTFLLDEFGDTDSLSGSITPSAFIKLDDMQSFSQKRTELQKKNPIWAGDIVMKPIISADGLDTYRFTTNEFLLKQNPKNYRSFDDAERLMNDLLQKREIKGVILQPFIPSVDKRGEYQLVFIDNQFSHATVKPKGFKNSTTSERKPLSLEELPLGMLDFAQRIMQSYQKKYPNGIIRARLDFFASDNGPILCEAEMVEPNTNIRRLSVEQQSLIVERYARALIKRTEQLQSLALLQEALEQDATLYSAMIQSSDICKAVLKIHFTHQEILKSLDAAGTKYSLAKTHGSIYLKECYQALYNFSKNDQPEQKDRNLLLHTLDKAKNNYSYSVLATDRSTTSKAVRLILMAAVNFIAALTFGIAHYVHYKNTGVALFFGETNSESQLRKAHQELRSDIERPSCAG